MIRVLTCEPLEMYSQLGFSPKSKLCIDWRPARAIHLRQPWRLRRYDLVLSTNYSSPFSNAMVMIAKQNGVPTVYMLDGVFEWHNAFDNPLMNKFAMKLCHPMIHDGLMCVGRQNQRYFADKVYCAMHYVPKRMPLFTRNEEKMCKSTFLVTTANTAYFNDNERDRLLRLLRAMLEALNRANIVCYYRIFDQRLVRALDIPEEQNIVSGDFSDVIQRFSGLVTTPSSVAMAGMSARVPTCVLHYRDGPIFVQSAWNASMSCDLDATVVSMLARDPDRMAFQDFILAEYKTDKIPDEVLLDLANVLRIKRCQGNSLPVSNSRETQHIRHYQRLFANFASSWMTISIESYLRQLYLILKRKRIALHVIGLVRRRIR